MNDDKLLLYLGIIQSVFEAVMYTFIFSWTPILTNLKPPLGIVFSLFMIALMIGSKLYAVLISNRYQPQNLLTFASILAAFAFITVSLSLTTIEFSIGMYFPAIGYLRGRVVPEECRATLTNWFRVPMNLITCLSLTLKHGNKHNEITTLKKFQFVFCLCSILLLITVSVTWIFSKKYVRKVLQDELSDVRTGKVQSGETV
ncbi:hypothetical protein AAG570_000322 [Ranatra chinensis]|uniref:Molybdate-anion transporter n=1 Tax=Ranatra chinensis TaxID=642074 RepID=A0ABD0YWR1_9HEMI